jgi:hypothetical protein
LVPQPRTVPWIWPFPVHLYIVFQGHLVHSPLNRPFGGNEIKSCLESSFVSRCPSCFPAANPWQPAMNWVWRWSLCYIYIYYIFNNRYYMIDRKPYLFVYIYIYRYVYIYTYHQLFVG